MSCKDSKSFYPAAGHGITGNLKIIPNSPIRAIILKDQTTNSLPTSTSEKKNVARYCVGI